MDVVEGSPTAPGRSPGELPLPRLDDRALRSVLDRHLLWLESDGADGARAELAGASLSGVSLWHADLRRANLDTADLTGANLDHARLGDASLKGASLAEASLWQADLSGADLTAADLGRAKLDHAVLRSSVLRGTGLGGATLWGAHLEGTDLSEAIGLVPSQLEPTSRDGKTRLPAAADGIVQAEQVSDVEDDPVVLDEHRGMMERRATEIRRQLAEVEAEQTALRRRQVELERFLFAAPSASWEEAAAKARYLLMLFADTSTGRDPRHQRIIADVLDDFRRLAGGQAEPTAPSNDL
jgi:hypothetical protein